MFNNDTEKTNEEKVGKGRYTSLSNDPTGSESDDDTTSWELEDLEDRLEKADLPQETLLEGSLTARPTFTQKEFVTNVVGIFLVTLVGEASRGLVIPSLAGYVDRVTKDDHTVPFLFWRLNDVAFVGVIVGAFSLGRLISSLVLGWLSTKRSVKDVMLLSLFLAFVGNLLYAFAEITSVWVLLLSRTIIGFATGVLSVSRAHIAYLVSSEELVKYMAWLAACQFAGFALTPGLGSLLTLVDFSIGPVPFDRYTSPGWVLVLSNLLVFFWWVFMMKSIPPTKEESEKQPIGTVTKRDTEYWFTFVGITLFILFNFVGRGVIALLETEGTPLYLRSIGASTENVSKAGMMFFYLGLGGMAVYFVIDFARKKIPNYLLLILSFIVVAVGSLLFLDFDMDGSIRFSRFLAGAILIWSLGSPISQVLIISTFAKMLGRKPQGTQMGYMTSAGSIGRILFPLLAVSTRNFSFGFAAASSFVCGAFLLGYQLMLCRWRGTNPPGKA
ncbi:MFS domain-containing protein [Balamuthia mandrillaris]